MRWQDVNKKLLAGATGGIILITSLFFMLGNLTGVDVVYVSPDQICNDCISEIHIKTTYWELCFGHNDKENVVFKKSVRGRRLWINLNKFAYTNPEIEDLEILVPTYGNKLRSIKDGDCIKRYTKANPKVGKIFIKGNPKGERVKWGLDYVNIDPVWVGYIPIFENLSKEVSIYENVLMNKTSVCKPENISCTPITHYWTSKKFVGYKTEYYEGKRIGIKFDGKEYKGNYNIKNDKLIKWNMPIGDRNFEEFGSCMPHEKAKGVCEETELVLEVIK